MRIVHTLNEIKKKFHHGKVLIIFVVLIVAIIITNSWKYNTFCRLNTYTASELKTKEEEEKTISTITFECIIIINVANCYVCVVYVHTPLSLSFYRYLLPFQILFRIDS